MILTVKQLINFWSHIKITPTCWEWTASKIQGYGQFEVNGKFNRSHRLMYAITTGNDPGSKCVCHKCDNPGCVNPDHLFLGNHDMNMKDKVSKNRQIKGERHPNAKLTLRQVENIRNSVESNRFLARKYGVAHSLICRIKHHKSWI